MERLTTVEAVRLAVAEVRRSNRTPLGFVPTMGALHAGHLALIHRACEECETVAVSVFVNPTQFNEKSDLDAYPRDLERDAALSAEAGADLLFAPSAGEMYSQSSSTTVLVEGTLARLLEGSFRPGHFTGVATVVAKLLGIVQPDRAYFGQKDWQQLKVIERMVADLNLPVAIVPCPTIREPDGLAMSSRNTRLSPEARKQALVIPYLLDTAQDLLNSSNREMPTHLGPVLRHWLLTLLESQQPTAELDYIAVVDPETLVDVNEITDRALVAIAVRIGGVRLIDNRIITVQG